MPLIIPASQTLVAGEQIIALSSNDWDYTFDGGGEWNTAGNALGDHDEGGYVYNTGGDSAISSLITLDGDFEIEWTMADVNSASFGVHAIDEDATRATADRVAMSSMTNSFWYREESVTDFHIGATAQSDTHTFANGSVIKIERISGTIKMYDDDVEVHSFSTTYSGTMRFGIGSPGSPFDSDYDNIKITDSEKVQRDGFLNNTTIANQGVGEGTVFGKAGILFRPTRTGEISSVTVNVATVNTTYTAHWELWSHDGTNPSSQIGSDSDSSSISATGNKIITWTTKPTVNKGTYYWLVLVDEGTNGSIDLNLHTDVTAPNWGSARHDTITSMAEDTNITSNRVWKCEIEIDTSAGEPTPDHDTLLLLQSDTTDGSTTFTDSSQVGRTVTVVGDTQHSTSIKKFGASSILFDGTGDYLTIADSTDWDFGTGDFTVDFWGYNLGGSDSNVLMFGDSSYKLTVGYIHTSTLVTYISSNGSSWDLANAVSMGTFPSTNWVHYALVRSGTSFKTYRAGTEISSFTSSATVVTGSGITIGRRNTDDLSGNIEELRISKVARWDADFTPPTAPYPTD